MEEIRLHSSDYRRRLSRAADDSTCWPLVSYEGYLNTVITRDIRTFAQVAQPGAIRRALALIAARAGSQVVLSDLANTLEIDRGTLRNYLAYLDMVFLLISIPPWSTNLNSRIAKSPKIFLSDIGLAAHLVGVTEQALLDPLNSSIGPLLETFVANELLKQQATQRTDFRIYHYRERSGAEVDFILEDAAGRVIAIEVKASTSPSRGADRHLQNLQARLGD